MSVRRVRGFLWLMPLLLVSSVVYGSIIWLATRYGWVPAAVAMVICLVVTKPVGSWYGHKFRRQITQR